MRRFHWRLQRVLDVKMQQEQALRLELVALTQKALELRQEIILRRSQVRTWLADMRDWSVERRIGQQDTIMRCVAGMEKQVSVIEQNLQAVKDERKTKTDELMTIRSARKTLERLYEDAYQEHVRKELLREQKELDDSAQMAFARRMCKPTVKVAG